MNPHRGRSKSLPPRNSILLWYKTFKPKVVLSLLPLSETRDDIRIRYSSGRDLYEQLINENGPSNMIEALLRHTDVMLEISEYLQPNDLINLYAASRAFRIQFKHNSIRFMRVMVKLHAPYAYKSFPYRSSIPLPIEEHSMGIRILQHKLHGSIMGFVPPFKWLQMAVWRSRISEQILRYLDQAGHHFPQDMLQTLGKLWFTMALPDIKSVTITVRNRSYWTKRDLVLIQLFFVKLDMYFRCLFSGIGGWHSFLPIVMAAPSLELLHNIIVKRLRNLNLLDTMLNNGLPRLASLGELAVLGKKQVPWEQIEKQGFGEWSQISWSVDAMLMEEIVRRRIPLSMFIMQFVEHGYSSKLDAMRFGVSRKEY